MLFRTNNIAQILGKKCNKRSIFFSFFDIETQSLKVRSITETVSEKSKKQKKLFKPDAFLTKQYCFMS